MNNKGSLYNNIMLGIILIGTLIGIIILFFLYTMIAPPATDSINTINGMVQGIVTDTKQSEGNLSNSLEISTRPISGISGIFEWVGYSMFVMLLVGYIMICYYVRSYPFLIAFWFIAIIGATLLSMILSNAYIDVSTGTDSIALAYQSYTTQDYMMTYLPHIIASTGLIAGIILFMIYLNNWKRRY